MKGMTWHAVYYVKYGTETHKVSMNLQYKLAPSCSHICIFINCSLCIWNLEWVAMRWWWWLWAFPKVVWHWHNCVCSKSSFLSSSDIIMIIIMHTSNSLLTASYTYIITYMWIRKTLKNWNGTFDFKML